MYMCTYVYVYVYVYMYTDVCVYVFVYVYVQTHTHTHKVREVDEKAQGASNEAKLLSCAAVLKAGVQTAELKHKTLSVKGAPLLCRARALLRSLMCLFLHLFCGCAAPFLVRGAPSQDSVCC